MKLQPFAMFLLWRFSLVSSLAPPAFRRLPTRSLLSPHGVISIQNCQRRRFHTTELQAKPKRGSVVDGYRTVSVNCKCRHRLFKYKKKNGTKSNLVKCYIERIAEDSAGILQKAESDLSQQNNGGTKTDLEFPNDIPQDYVWECPSCNTQFARTAHVHGLPALKLVGGKVTMTKK